MNKRRQAMGLSKIIVYNVGRTSLTWYYAISVTEFIVMH